MNELVQRFREEPSPLRSEASWPDRLRAAADLCFAADLPMAVVWGPERFRVDNEGFGRLRTAGAWASVSVLLDAAASRAFAGASTQVDDQRFLLDEDGQAKETFYSFSFSPIRDDSDTVCGVFQLASDTTDRVLAERRSLLLRDLALETGQAKTIDEVFALTGRLFGERPDVPFLHVHALDALVGRESSAVLFEALNTRQAVLIADPEPGMALPIRAAERPVAIVVAGVSALLKLDGRYRQFYERLAETLSRSASAALARDEDRRCAERLAQLDRARTGFLGDVGRELRMPLSLLQDPIDQALSSPEGAMGGFALKVAQRNVARLLRLVDELHDFSSLETGRPVAWFQATDLAALTVELASMFGGPMEAAGLELAVHCDPLPECVYVDQEMWEKIVLNLLSNALKFTLEGRIDVSLRARGDLVQLSVRDTGVGIKAKDLPRVFGHFHHVSRGRARSAEGLGIGLALVKKLVEIHGGEVSVKSEVDKGTTFTVLLRFGTAHLPAGRVGYWRTAASPLANARPYLDEAAHWSHREGPMPLEQGVSAGHILVADDNADMREYLARLLGQRWNVETVSDTAGVMEALARRNFDLLVADCGLALLRSLRSKLETRSLPVILLSASAREESRMKGMAAGANDCLVKPFSSREALARVETQLRLGRSKAKADQEWRELLALLEQLPLPISIWVGPAHRFSFVNEAHRRLVGRDLTGAEVRELECWPEEDLERIDHVYRTGETVSLDEHALELRDPTRADPPRYFNSILQPVRDQDDQVRGILRVSIEVTDQVVARQQREQLLASAQVARSEAVAANRSKDEFLAMLGHELRNPLSPIITALELMRLRGLESREQEVIERQVCHLARLVDDLLDISRITRGTIEVRKERVELRSLVARALETVSPMLEHRSQRVQVAVPASLTIEADPDRFAQVISNLLTNASRYSHPGSGIEVRAERRGGQVRLRVRDDGVGIPPDLLERIFEPFVQQPQPMDRSIGGLGLGLAIVRSLVQLHGGRVLAHSDGPGRGSEFIVEMSLVKEGSAIVETPEHSVEVAPVAVRRRVLVVDDNCDLADTLGHALGRLGYEVEVAYDGPSALERAAAFGPDIALLDIGLPVMDGYELAERLREHRSEPGAFRLVAVTGYGQEKDRARAAAAGFDRHLVKPVDLLNLRRVLEELSA